MGHYEVTVCCDNCGWEGPHTFLQGTLIEEEPCPVCDCLKLHRREEAYGHITHEIDTGED